MKTNIPKHPCANKCTDFKEEQCKTCLIPNNSMELESIENDFLIGDVVVYSDVLKPSSLMTVHHVQDEGVLLNGNRHFALNHLVRHADARDLREGKRHTPSLDELICDLSGLGGAKT